MPIPTCGSSLCIPPLQLLLLLSHFSHVRLCDPMDGSPLGLPLSLGFSRQQHWSGLPFPSPTHGSEQWKWSCSVVSDLVTPWTAAYQAPPSMGFSRQEYWSGLPTAILKYQLGVLQFNPVMTPPIQRHHQIPKGKGLLPGEWPPLQRPNTRSGCHVILSHCKSEFPKVSFLLFSCSVVSDSLWPHGLQHARLPCPSPSPGACSNSHPLSQWCHSTILSSVVPFSSCLQSFPASGSFLMNWLFVSGGQSIGASASA